MRLGVDIIYDEHGEVLEERKVVIEDEATTVVCKPRHYTYGWEIREF